MHCSQTRLVGFCQFRSRCQTAYKTTLMVAGSFRQNESPDVHFPVLSAGTFPLLTCRGQVKPKQGVDFSVIFPGNGISLVLEHLSGTGIQPHVTPDVSVVAKIWL